MLTEARNPKTMRIDQLSALEIVRVMNQEDATVAQAVEKALPDIAQAVEAIVEGIRAGGRLIYVGAGTSGRLGILDAAECVPTFGTSPEQVLGIIAGGKEALVQAIEGAEDHDDKGEHDVLALRLRPQDVVVGIAASGRTPYVVGALKAANQIGAVTVGVSCNVPSPILDVAKIKIVAVTGPEVITGSTRLKAGTAQKLILNMLSTASMIKLGKVYGNLMVDVQVTNEKLAQRARRIVAEVVGVSEDDAYRLLRQTDNEVKTAIVVGLLHVSPEEARQKLTASHGILHEVIG